MKKLVFCLLLALLVQPIAATFAFSYTPEGPVLPGDTEGDLIGFQVGHSWAVDNKLIGTQAKEGFVLIFISVDCVLFPSVWRTEFLFQSKKPVGFDTDLQADIYRYRDYYIPVDVVNRIVVTDDIIIEEIDLPRNLRSHLKYTGPEANDVWKLLQQSQVFHEDLNEENRAGFHLFWVSITPTDTSGLFQAKAWFKQQPLTVKTWTWESFEEVSWFVDLTTGEVTRL